MPKKLFFCIFFACLGITTEICFVAFTNLFNNTPFCGEPLWSLTGKTYVWMLPIYTLIPFFAGYLYHKIAHWQSVVRWTFYTALILSVEFVAGFILEQVTGQCPWEYTTGWHIMGYIRLDYIPAWFIFSFVVEYLYVYLDRNLKT